MKIALTLISAILTLSVTVISAGVPNTISYQGKLTSASGAPVPNGAILINFTIYDADTNGTVLWSSGFQPITTAGGLFSYDLGSVVALPDLFGTDSVLYLGITVGTNPEMSPRTQFTSAGYTLKALKSELALDADSLGGLQPAFYLDWGNMTNVPVGFADGEDNIGVDQATADSQYVKKTGDTITGNLSFQSGGIDQIALDADSGRGINIFGLLSGEKTAQLSGTSGGRLQLWDDQNPPIKTVDMLASGVGGKLHLMNPSGVQTITLRGGQPGDLSVSLPTGAINNVEILNEPGIAANRANSHVTLSDFPSPPNKVTDVTITIPSAGYIVVEAIGVTLFLNSTTRIKGWLRINEGAGGQWDSYYSVLASFAKTTFTVPLHQSIPVRRIYFKNSGTYTFRLEGGQLDGSSSSAIIVTDASIQATYYPTSYGSVITVAGQPGDNPTAKAVTITGPDGRTKTGYKMDLRYYEEKARAAEIAAQKAELDKLQAQTDLERARQTSKQD